MATAQIPLPTNMGTSYTIVTHVIPSSPAPTTDHQNSSQNHNPLRLFLNVEPKALGTVQIMIGVLMILFGIVLTIDAWSISIFSGIVFWAAIFHIIAGSLAVSASNKLNSCAVNGTLVMSIFSTISAGVSIIIMLIDLAISNMSRYCYYNGDYNCRNNPTLESRTLGIIGVLLVFSLLQFSISIAVSVFSCKTTCKACRATEPTMNMINVVPNPVQCPPVHSSFPPAPAPAYAPAYAPVPAHAPVPAPVPAQPGVNMMHAVAMGGQQYDNPPSYCEKS